MVVNSWQGQLLLGEVSGESTSSNINGKPVYLFSLVYKTGCPLGSSLQSAVSSECVACPLGSYSALFNESSCTNCPYTAMTTPSTGTTSKSQCFNPISSFLLAIVTFMIAPLLVLVYFIQCRLHFISFVRVQLVVSRVQFTVQLICQYVKEVGK